MMCPVCGKRTVKLSDKAEVKTYDREFVAKVRRLLEQGKPGQVEEDDTGILILGRHARSVVDVQTNGVITVWLK